MVTSENITPAILDTIRTYIKIAIKRWHIILLLAAMVTVATYILEQNEPDTYTGQASVSLLNVRNYVEIDGQMVFRDDTPSTYLDPAHRDGLVSLVESQKVLEDARIATFNAFEQEKDLDSLDSFGFSTNAVRHGDQLVLTVTHRDPEIAAYATNKWAEIYAEEGNNAYVITGGSSLEKLQQETDLAFTDYQREAQIHSDYLRDDPSLAFAKEIDLLAMQLNGFSNVKNSIYQSESAYQQESAERLVSASRSGNFTIDALESKRNEIYNLKVTLESLQSGVELEIPSSLSAAQVAILVSESSLGRLVEDRNSESSSGTGESSTSVTYSSQQSPVTMDVTQLVSESDPLTKEQLLSYIGTLDSELERLDREISTAFESVTSADITNETYQAQLASLLDSSSTAVTVDSDLYDATVFAEREAELYQLHRDLTASYNESIDQRQITQRGKSRAWETYIDLHDRYEEAKVQAAIGKSQLVVAVPSIVPYAPNPTSLAKDAVTNGILATVLVTGVVFLVDGVLFPMFPMPTMSVTRRREPLMTPTD